MVAHACVRGGMVKRQSVDAFSVGEEPARWHDHNALANPGLPPPLSLDLAHRRHKPGNNGVRLDRSDAGSQSGRQRKRKREWEPGKNTHGYVGRGRGGGGRVLLQVCVLMANAHVQLQLLPLEDRRLVRSLFQPVGAPHSFSATTISTQILSGLFCVPCRTVQNSIARALGSASRGPRSTGMAAKEEPTRDRQAWRAAPGGEKGLEGSVATEGEATQATQPSTPVNLKVGAVGDVSVGVEVDMAGGTVDDPAQCAQVPEGLVNTVRVTQFIATHGLPKTLLPNIMQLISLAGGNVGASHHSRHFCSVAEVAGDQLVGEDTVRFLQEPLPATGRPPDLEVFVDGGTVGQQWSRCRDQVLVVGVACSVPWPPYTATVFIGAVNERADGRADQVQVHMQAAFDALGQRCGVSWLSWLRERFAVAVGDGALAPGGEQGRLQRLGLKLLWEGQRPRRDVVDLFHLLNRSGNRAVKESDACQNFFDVCEELEKCFALGHGRHVDRTVANYLEQRHLVCMSPCGTKKIVYLAKVPERFLQKYACYFFGAMVRMQHALQGRGTRTFAEWKSLGQKMSNPSLVVFALGLASGLAGCVVPICLQVQTCTDLPWTRWRALKKTLGSLRAEPTLLEEWQGRLFILSFLESYLKPRDAGLRALWEAWCLSPQGRRVCVGGSGVHLGWRLREMYLTGSYQGCGLFLPILPPSPGARLAHPACQCVTRPRAQVGCAILARGGGTVQDHRSTRVASRMLPVPWWVSKTLYAQVVRATLAAT